MNIAIAGAGIAGLASAAFLARAGHTVTVFDRFDAPRPVGSGLMVQPVGLAVLDRLGLAEQLVSRASPIRRIYGETFRGLPILDVKYDDLRTGLVGHAVQRATLFDLLLQAAQDAGAQLTPGTRITGHATGFLKVDDQRVGPFDLIVDALGAYSPLCPKPSAPLHFGALWALLNWPEDGPFHADRLEQRYEFARKMVGVLPVGQSAPSAPRRLTFFWSLRASDQESWRATSLVAWKDEVRSLWPETEAILDQITSHGELTFAQYTHRTLWRPYGEGIVHIGDSFHATSPQLGQGANMALLDAAALAAAARSAPVDRIGEQFASLRSRHVRLYQAASWLFTPLYQSDSRLLPWIRNRLGAPFAQLGPVRKLLASLVAGETGRPLTRLFDDVPD
ncbi:MAG: NAD(P)/FAD-dependent oxidoreductase [Pseudomonadota bacterium]